ncbi:HdeD family acid-resistance protein [Streptomyces prasinus]|uniref:HdeD family acid-resistance protein n=1 Tax=Streptomyces prasinus TaxID=67345 RepID=UPI003673CCB9
MTMPRGPASHAGEERRPAGAGPGPRGDSAYVLARLGRSWTWLLGSAATTVVPGVLVLVWPEGTLHVLAVLVGLYLLVTGAFRFVAVFGREEHGERLPGLLLAVLYVLAGVLCLRHPLQTVAALSLIVGVVWLVSGILTLYTALVARDLPHRGVVLGAAVLGIVAGIVVLALPAESARALTRLLGLWLVLLGLAEAAVALAWRAALRKAHVTGPHAPA